MPTFFSSTLFLTVLLAIGLVFFLRAASKDRTTDVDICSPLPPLIVLDGITIWLEQRGWKRKSVDIERQWLQFYGNVAFSKTLVLLLSILGALGSGSLGLVLKQLYPSLNWWPLCLAILGGPLAGYIYKKRAEREEMLEVRLVSLPDSPQSNLKIRAHRDELIALELELAETLKLKSDGSLLASPI